MKGLVGGPLLVGGLGPGPPGPPLNPTLHTPQVILRPMQCIALADKNVERSVRK